MSSIIKLSWEFCESIVPVLLKDLGEKNRFHCYKEEKEGEERGVEVLQGRGGMRRRGATLNLLCIV